MIGRGFAPIMFGGKRTYILGGGPFFGGHHCGGSTRGFWPAFGITAGITAGLGLFSALFGHKSSTTYSMSGYYPGTSMMGYPGMSMGYPGLNLSKNAEDPLSGLKGLYSEYNFEMIEGKYCARLKDGSGDVITASSQQELMQKLGTPKTTVSDTAQRDADKVTETKRQSAQLEASEKKADNTTPTESTANNSNDDEKPETSETSSAVNPTAGENKTSVEGRKPYTPKSGQYWYGIVEHMFVKEGTDTLISGKDLAALTDIVKTAHDYGKKNKNMPSVVQLPNEVKINGTKYTLSQEHINDIPRDTKPGGVTENKNITPVYQEEYNY